MYCRNSMRGKIYHQTIFFPHLIISFLASFFSKFPISTLFLLFVSLLQLQNPFFLCSFISRSFCCSPSLFFSFLPPPPPQILYFFILFYSTIWRPRLYFPCFLFATELYKQSDGIRQHSYLNMSRAETKSRRLKALLYRLGSISWIYLLLHFSDISLSLPLFARSESVIRKPCLNIHVFTPYQNHRRPNTSPLKNCYQILITQVSTVAVTTTATYGMRYSEVLE